MLRVTCPWHDMHERDAKWNSVYVRFQRWVQQGVPDLFRLNTGRALAVIVRPRRSTAGACGRHGSANTPRQAPLYDCQRMLAVRIGRSVWSHGGQVHRGSAVDGHRSAIAEEAHCQTRAVLARVVADGIGITRANRRARSGIRETCKHQGTDY